jgi:hypothetical protein
MLPNFLIIGVEKAATTWLAACLAEHPDIFVTPCKETCYFVYHYYRGPQWYVETFFGDWSGEKAVGEATPEYILRNYVPSRIDDTLEQVKFIASLRHPIDRAYSAFWHRMRQAQIPPDSNFPTALSQADRCDLQDRGYYFRQLRRYFERFPPEIIKVFLYDEILHDSSDIVAQAFEFLGVDPQFSPANLYARLNRGERDIGVIHRPAQQLAYRTWQTLSQLGAEGLLPQRFLASLLAVGQPLYRRLTFELGPKQRLFEPLDPALRHELLHEYYLDDIMQLEQLLDRDLSLWYTS